jgi:hypothetical protein
MTTSATPAGLTMGGHIVGGTLGRGKIGAGIHAELLALVPKVWPGPGTRR